MALSMKRKDFLAKLIKMSVKDLVKMRNDLRKELHQMKMKNAMRSQSQTHQIRTTRRNIARVNTILTSKITEAYGNNMR